MTRNEDNLVPFSSDEIIFPCHIHLILHQSKLGNCAIVFLPLLSFEIFYEQYLNECDFLDMLS